MTLYPRFSLLGGWNLTWDLSYNTPSDEFIKQNTRDGEDFIFTYKLAPLLATTPSDIYTLKVALPEGAKVISEKIDGFQPHKTSRELTYSFLDYVGRPTLTYTFKRHFARPGRNDAVTIKYQLSIAYMAVSPLYTVCLLMATFIIYLVISRVDLAFGDIDEKSTKKSI